MKDMVKEDSQGFIYNRPDMKWLYKPNKRMDLKNIPEDIRRWMTSIIYTC